MIRYQLIVEDSDGTVFKKTFKTLDKAMQWIDDNPDAGYYYKVKRL